MTSHAIVVGTVFSLGWLLVVTILCMALAENANAGVSKVGTVPEAPVTTVEIHPDKISKPLNPGFIGANNLYWIDDDKAWANRAFVGQLKALGVNTLRYPGGEVADNFDWETNRVERPDRFPFEAKTTADREGRLDYLEFLAHARAAGTPNLFFVVNLEGAFLSPGTLTENIERYAEKAARWVRAVRDAGYRVEYWEVGNEPYLKSAFALTAHEYANALKIFYRKMKAADPSIKIGAVGPHAHSGSDAIGFADSLGAAPLAAYRSALQRNDNPCRKLPGRRCLRKLGYPVDERAEAISWWDVVLREARDSFDFAVIHRYRMARVSQSNGRKVPDVTLAQYIGGLKRHIESAKGKSIELALTEWNTPVQLNQRLSNGDHALEVVEQLGNYLEGGVDFTMYWPMRMRGAAFPLFSFKSLEPSLTYQALALARRYIGTRLLTVSGGGKGLSAWSSESARGYEILLVNRPDQERCVKLVANGMVAGDFSGEVLQVDSLDAKPVALSSSHLRASKGVICLPGRTVAGLQFTK